METTVIIFAGLIVIGIMLFINGIILKTKHHIPRWMLKNVELNSSSDIDGFAIYMWLKTMIAAFVTFCYAIYYFIANTEKEIEYSTYVPITYVFLIMAYMIIMTGAKDKFLKRS